ncbi:gliding motility lipoprotein GldH [Cesiribacter sp. SM1]|uniref:gliding motility lipoprotein GldH n=1 Tax=Cesiribacter sp. SM1 TaxID=2861196 RepID=UPI001CD54F56|nr:gliding motility lipoprotein GldH [Cesiribacter sp. SM1]
MVNNLKAAFAGLSLLLVLNACDEQRVYERNVDIEEYAWHKDSVVHLQVPIENADIPYNIYYNVRNALSYPAQNLYLQIEIADTTGRTIATDLNNIELFDRQTGKPYGEGLGDIFDHQIPVYRDFRFPHAGVYDVKIQHQMRETDRRVMQGNHLPYIMSVGIRVEKAGAQAQGQ